MKRRTFRSIGAVTAAALALSVGLSRLRSRSAKLESVGPTLLSNQTSMPLSLYGEGFQPGLQLILGSPFDRTLPITVDDARHAFAVLPSDLKIPDDQVQVDVALSVSSGTGSRRITVVNDQSFSDFTALAVFPDGTAAAISTPTDQLVLSQNGTLKDVHTQDGPSAFALQKERLWVAHRFSPTLDAYDAKGQRVATLSAPSSATALAIEGETAYLAETAGNSISALDLQTGQTLWRTWVSPNPGVLALAGDFLAVGSQQTGEIELLTRADGKIRTAIVPNTQTSIVGGTTEAYARYVMGGKAVRALAYLPSANALLVSSIGPNIGPNPDRMEVSMNAGVGVVDLASGKFIRHLGFGAGVVEGLAVDEANGKVYAADTGLGLIRVLDLRKLIASDASARTAQTATWPASVPAQFPRVRPTADWGNRLAGIEVHAGPRALALAGNTLRVLNRHTATLDAFDVNSGVRGMPIPLIKDAALQSVRRQGQVLYFADVGQTGMSCDACHLEGHTEGIFFSKTRPLRIYRSPTVRGTRETPPYFTPASTRSLAETARVVGNRNRYHRADLSISEIDALTTYTAAMTVGPNPFRDVRGVPLSELPLPNGNQGRPGAGRATFERDCQSCHPAPLFTTDQSPQTRGRYQDVGTPHALPLRTEQQDLLFKGFPPPSLLGTWDIFPQLSSGAAGLAVEGDQVQVHNRCATCEVLEHFSGPQHGNAQALTDSERDDLLAFLLTL